MDDLNSYYSRRDRCSLFSGLSPENNKNNPLCDLCVSSEAGGKKWVSGQIVLKVMTLVYFPESKLVE